MIFGASSFVGSNLAQALKNDFRIIGTYHNTPVKIPGITCVPCDVLKKDYVTKLVGLFKPDFTVYAVGMTSLKECKLKPKHADALNSAGAINVCSASERSGAKFVLISSCYVLGGEDQIYREGDLPIPSTAYGNSLSAAEFYVQRSCLNYLILRCSPLYGRSFNPLRPNFFEVVLNSIAKNEQLQVDDNVYTGFLDVEIMAKVLKITLDSNVTNRLFQVSSSNSMTRYEFALEIAKALHRPSHTIQRASIPFPVESNAQKKSGKFFYKMDSFNLEDFLGTKMPSISESLILTGKRMS